MSDLYCAKCGEPWDAYGVNMATVDNSGDMTAPEARRFQNGDGCPSCRFGTECPICSGSGIENRCETCHGNGRTYVWRPRRSARGFSSDRFYSGYTPNVRVVPIPEGSTLLRIESYETADGWVDSYRVECFDCKAIGDPCARCEGTGLPDAARDPNTAEDMRLEAARSELRWSDGEPIGILIRRGIL